MFISITALKILVYAAFSLVLVTPLILLYLWFRDTKEKKLW